MLMVKMDTNYIHCTKYEKILWDKFHIILPFTRFGRCIRKIACVAAINGGDGFSDIYREESMDRFNYFHIWL